MPFFFGLVEARGTGSKLEASKASSMFFARWAADMLRNASFSPALRFLVGMTIIHKVPPIIIAARPTSNAAPIPEAVKWAAPVDLARLAGEAYAAPARCSQ